MVGRPGCRHAVHSSASTDPEWGAAALGPYRGGPADATRHPTEQTDHFPTETTGFPTRERPSWSNSPTVTTLTCGSRRFQAAGRVDGADAGLQRVDPWAD